LGAIVGESLSAKYQLLDIHRKTKFPSIFVDVFLLCKTQQVFNLVNSHSDNLQDHNNEASRQTVRGRYQLTSTSKKKLSDIKTREICKLLTSTSTKPSYNRKPLSKLPINHLTPNQTRPHLLHKSHNRIRSPFHLQALRNSQRPNARNRLLSYPLNLIAFLFRPHRSAELRTGSQLARPSPSN